MTFDAVWRQLRERCDSLDPNAALVTPGSERVFRIEVCYPDRIRIRYRETDNERVLRREGFDALHDRLAEGDDLSIADLPPGVEPYVAVLSLSPRYTVDESAGVIHSAEDEAEPECPFLREGWEVRTAPERIHDDALLLADFLADHDVEDLETTAAETVVDLYVLLSDVQRGADGLRRDVRDALLDRIGPEGRLRGQFGTVSRSHRERRHLKDDAAVFDALDEEDIPKEWVLGVDQDRLDVVLAVTGLQEEDVYDIEEQVYVQKTGVEEEAKRSRLQGLRDRLDALDDEEADRLRDEIDDLESRLDALLSAD